MAPRGRGRPAKVNTQAEQLMTALNFIAPATGEHEWWHKIVRLRNNFAVAFNGVVAAGHPIAEELNANAHHEKLTVAINRCGKSLVIGETPGGQLSVKGDKLRALVPCAPPEDIVDIYPDPPVAMLTDVLKEAFKVCGSLASEAANEAILASVLLEANTCTGTNKQAMLQYWHGIDLPPAMVLPKMFALAVAKQTKPLTGFGFSWNNGIVGSVTFHFEGGAWIKTQCYQDRWPDVNRILNVQAFPLEIPAGLFEGVAAVAEFNDAGWVTFGDGKVQSHRSDQEGAQYDVAGLQAGKQFGGRLFGQIAPYARTIDLTTYPDRAFFFGGEAPHMIRGAVMGIIENSHGPAIEPEPSHIEDIEGDDEEQSE